MDEPFRWTQKNRWRHTTSKTPVGWWSVVHSVHDDHWFVVYRFMAGQDEYQQKWKGQYHNAEEAKTAVELEYARKMRERAQQLDPNWRPRDIDKQFGKEK